MVDNSHSVASASSEGSVHVWRVDVVSGNERRRGSLSSPPPSSSSSSSSSSSIGNSPLASASSPRAGGFGLRRTGNCPPTHPPMHFSISFKPSALPLSTLPTHPPTHPLTHSIQTGVRVAGNGSLIRCLDVQSEGPVVCIAHFTTESASLLVYATQKGLIHCWDLRTDTEVWTLAAPKELGYLTALSLGTDRQSWLACGTNRGYLLLFDLRFQLLVKVSLPPTHPSSLVYPVVYPLLPFHLPTHPPTRSGGTLPAGPSTVSPPLPACPNPSSSSKREEKVSPHPPTHPPSHHHPPSYLPIFLPRLYLLLLLLLFSSQTPPLRRGGRQRGSGVGPQ